MIDRLLAKTLGSELAEYPVVTVFGPRQSGKTTLVRACCPNFGYVSMEDKETRDAAASDYKSFFVNHPPPLIIDEVQRLPEIVAAVQSIVDSKRHWLQRDAKLLLLPYLGFPISRMCEWVYRMKKRLFN